MGKGAFGSMSQAGGQGVDRSDAGADASVQVKDRWLMGRLDDILSLTGQITAETD